MNNNYEICRNKLTTGEFATEFEGNIEKVDFADGVYIVLLGITDEKNNINSNVFDNIYGVNTNGETIWRIQSIQDAFPINEAVQVKYGNVPSDAYVGMGKSQEDIFHATTFSAMRYYFNHKTGKIVRRECIGW